MGQEHNIFEYEVEKIVTFTVVFCLILLAGWIGGAEFNRTPGTLALFLTATMFALAECGHVKLEDF